MIGPGVGPTWRLSRGGFLPSSLSGLTTWARSDLGITIDNASVLVDGDMESVGTSAYTSTGVLTKESGARTGGSGSRILRVSHTTTADARQTGITSIGTEYRYTGWARGDGGVARPGIGDSARNDIWEGTNSTTWQSFDVTFTATLGRVLLGRLGVGSGHVEFDDVTVIPTVYGVSAWADQSGNGHDLLQATKAKQPGYVASGGPNNHPYLAFDGTDDFLKASYTLSQPVTRFIVCLPSVSDGSSKTVIDGVTTITALLYVVTVDKLRLAGVGSFNGPDYESSAWQRIRMHLNGVSSSIQVNSLDELTGSIGAPVPGGMTLGIRGDEVTHPADCYIAEVIEYDRILAADEEAKVIAYLDDRYEIVKYFLGIPGLTARFRSDLGITIATGVSAWADQGGNGNDLLQAVGSKQPAYSASGGGPNNRPYVGFDGIDDFLKGQWRQWQPTTKVVVTLPSVSDGTLKVMFDGYTNLSGMLDISSVADQVRMYAGAPITKSGVEASDWHGIAAVFNDASSSLVVDNGTPTAGFPGNADPHGLTMGVRGNDTTTPGDCRIGEYVEFERALSSGELSTIWGYISTYWGLP